MHWNKTWSSKGRIINQSEQGMYLYIAWVNRNHANLKSNKSLHWLTLRFYQDWLTFDLNQVLHHNSAWIIANLTN